MNASQLFWLAPVGSLLALVYAYYFYSTMMKSDPGSEKSQEIANYVREGARSYLWAQYKVVGLFFIIAFAFFAFLAFVLEVQSPWTPLAFLTGGFFSTLSGYIGMRTATRASCRTATAAAESLNAGLQTAFRSGAVMGFVVVGLGLLDISIWWKILTYVFENKELFKDSIFAVNSYTEITTIMLTFGMGASSQALFARVGGGIFTKAADVGADLVGKTEAGIPEDDPRNPAVIADNVGDNVGDVAGMGADLYESYCGSILATAALGAAAFNTPDLSKYQLNSILLPMAIAGAGIVFSIFGTYSIHTDEDATQKELMGALNRGINFAAFFTAVGSVALVNSMLPHHFRILGSIVTGLMAGIIIGWATNYYTSEDYEPTKHIAEQSTTGPATVIIEGISTGMMSTAIPVITVCFGMLLAYGFAGGFENPSMGLYGIGIAAVGMLSTLGITLATDAYGPIADNAGGNAQMSGMIPEVRKRTDALDSLGNTTAATGKGFAIGSAALTAMALLGAYIEEIRMALLRVAKFSSDSLSQYIFPSPDKKILIENATLHDFMDYYNVNLMNPIVLAGIFIGSMLVFVFCAMTMQAVGRAAHSMVEEVRRQFKEIPGLLKGEEGVKADYASCVEISTQGAQREMVKPSLLAIFVPILTGLILGVSGVIGMLVGGLATGFAVAIMMSNAGGAWDNAKKYVESGQFGGKGSDNHKAAVVGDTVGDPFKDTAGPSLNILIKLMSMVAVVVAGLTVSYSTNIQNLIGFEPTDLKYKQEYVKNNQNEESDVYRHSGSSIYEDPLLGTEDIILPSDDEIMFSSSTSKQTQPVSKPQSENKNSVKENANVSNSFSGFDSTTDESKKDSVKTDGFGGGFGGGFDSFDSPTNTSAPAKTEEKSDSFSSGFDSFDAPANTNTTDKSDSFSSGFDSFDAPATEKAKEPEVKSDNFSNGFDSFDAPATEKTKEPEVKSDGFSNGFDSLNEQPKTEVAPKVEETKSEEVKPEKATDEGDATKVEETSKTEVAPKVEETSKTEEAPKVEGTSKAEEKTPAEEAPKTENSQTTDAFSGGFDAF